MLKDNELVGAFLLGRQEVRPFTDKQIELVETFADQAVLAVENVRLFEEVQARTKELAQSVGELQALGEVIQAVNSTVDLETVLTTIVAKATQLSKTEAGAIYVFNDANQEFLLRATYGLDDTVAVELRPAASALARAQSVTLSNGAYRSRLRTFRTIHRPRSISSSAPGSVPC